MPEITRISAGVIFESDVLFYVDRLAGEQGRSRSFIISQIIRVYARMAGMEPQPPEMTVPVKPPREISPEKRINF